MNSFWMIPLLVGLSILLPNIHADTLIQNLEGGMEIEITYPEEIVDGREGFISILVKNNGWEDKQDISFVFSSYSYFTLDPFGISIVTKKLISSFDIFNLLI